MRGLDGNYMNMQGDASTRIQVAYLAEQSVQQARVQAETVDSLRRLREEVKESQAGNASSNLSEVKDYRDGQSNSGQQNSFADGRKDLSTEKEVEEKLYTSLSHVDLKV